MKLPPKWHGDGRIHSTCYFGLCPHGNLGLLNYFTTAFLSYLRLSVYMAIVSVAMTLSFHLSHQPTDLERRMAEPLGAIFWVLAVLMLGLGIANYISMSFSDSIILHCFFPFIVWSDWVKADRTEETINLYSQKAAIVQTGWKTQTVCSHVYPFALFIEKQASHVGRFLALSRFPSLELAWYYSSSQNCALKPSPRHKQRLCNTTLNY